MSHPLDRGAEANELFARALDLPEEEREAFLVDACGEDRELRTAVERLLRAGAETGDLLATGGAWKLAASELDGEEEEPGPYRSRLRPGTTLAHYRILDELGTGGMGEVYLAEDTRLERRVALKVLPRRVTDDETTLRRFWREAKTVAALNHRNIVTLFSIEEADGTHFLTMELVEGKTLGELIPAGGLELGKLLAITAGLADALAAAHERGIIHRDLKPANVLVDDQGEVKVLDFGLAKHRSAVPGESLEATLTALTAHGAIFGTIPYMSPEQVAGRPLDHRSDIFSLGVVLYEMCTGERPFRGETSSHTMSAILRDSPTPVREIRKDLPESLSRIVQRCLEKEPERRYRQIGDLRRDLQDAQRQMRTGRGSTASRARWRRLTLVGALAALTTVGLWTWLPGEDPGQRPDLAPAGSPVATRTRIAVLPFQNLGAPEDELFADGMTEEITSRLAAVSALAVISRDSADRYADTDKPTRQIGAELGVEYLLGGTIRWARAPAGGSRLRITPRLVSVAEDTRLWSESFDRPYGDVFALQSEIAAAVVDRLGITLPKTERQAIETQPTRSLEAWEAYLRGRNVGIDCQARLERMKDAERAVVLDPEFARAWTTVAFQNIAYHKFCRATEQTRRRARTALDRALQLAPSSEDTIFALADYTKSVERDYDGALAWIESAGETVRRSGRIQRLEASLLRRKGRWQEAIALYQRALELNPRSFLLAHDLALSLANVRDYPRALGFYDRSIALGSTLAGDWQQKAQVYWLWRGDTIASRAVLEAVPSTIEDDGGLTWAWFWQEIYENRPQAALERLDASGRDWISDYVHLWPRALCAALAHELAGDPQQARAAYGRARDVLLAEVADAPDDHRMRTALSLANAGLGLEEEAIADARWAIDRWPIEEHPWWGVAPLHNLAWVYTRVGEHDLALDLVERLLALPGYLTISILELDPRWAPLREHPRYRELVRAARAERSSIS